MTYKYNDAGERIFKTGPHGETVYLNQFFSVSNREGGSKHVFVGTTRIATKLVKGQVNVTTPSSGLPPGHIKNGGGKGIGRSGNNGGGSGGGSPGNGMIIFEPDVFYFHPDHLGSTTYVTDLTGEVYQHLEYFPFGETWVEEVSNRWRVPYLFTAKELDRETGLYYFRARYYDPKTSVWQSGDPIIGDYLPESDKKVELVLPSLGNWNVKYDLPGMGGVFATGNLNLYTYVQNDPINFTDPLGLWTFQAGFSFTAGGVVGTTKGIGVIVGRNPSTGDWQFGWYAVGGAGPFAGAEASLSLDLTWSGNPCIEDVSGFAFTAGASGGLPFGFGAGGESNIPLTGKASPSYTIMGDISAGLPAEGHAFSTYTHVNKVW